MSGYSVGRPIIRSARRSKLGCFRGLLWRVFSERAVLLSHLVNEAIEKCHIPENVILNFILDWVSLDETTPRFCNPIPFSADVDETLPVNSLGVEASQNGEEAKKACKATKKTPP